MSVKHVKRKSDGEIIDVPDGHYSLTSDEFEVVEPKKKAPKKAKKAAK